jgi:hypothetical protein
LRYSKSILQAPVGITPARAIIGTAGIGINIYDSPLPGLRKNNADNYCQNPARYGILF